MKKELASLLLAAALIMPTGTLAAETGFIDTAGLPEAEAISFLAEKEIVTGKAEGIYDPEAALTRAEMTAIVLRAYGEEDTEILERFSDVPPSHWAFLYVERAYGMGIINGVSETEFQPEGKVTREQAVKMLVCALGKEKDAQAAGGYPAGYMAVAEEAGILEGTEGEGNAPISRAAMAQLVFNSLSGSYADFMIDWEGLDPCFDWIRKERVRGVYGAVSDLMCLGEEGVTSEVMDKAVAAGANTFFLNIIAAGPQDETYEGIQQILDETVEKMKRYEGAHTFMKINFGDNGYTKNNEFGMYHPGILKDSYTTTPCPLSEEYWEKQIYSRSELIASYPEFDGIVLDCEMYSGGVSSYPSSCMCDDCWEKFWMEEKAVGDWKNIEITKRSDYNKNAGKSDAYTAWMEKKVEEKFAEARDRILAINPNCLIAYMPGFEWFPGMTRGLGTPTHPCLILSEAEYWGGLADTKTTMRKIKQEGYPALYVPGLFPGPGGLNSLDLFAERLNQVNTIGAGFWIFNAKALDSDQEHYSVMAEANRYLDEKLEKDIVTPLPEYSHFYYTASKIAGDTPTEAEWEKAKETETFLDYRYAEDGKLTNATRAKILYSDTELFVRFICYETDMKNKEIFPSGERDGGVFANDLTEVYWKYDDTTISMHLAADIHGTLWDAQSSGIGTQNKDYNYDFGVETKCFTDRWEQTYRIPGSVDGVRQIQKGDVLRFELARARPANAELGETLNACWAVTYGGYLASQSLWNYVTLG